MKRTPLHISASCNSKEIGELLISKGADINPIDIYLSNYNIMTFFTIIYD